MQEVLAKHQKIFETPKGLPPFSGEQYRIIPLISRSHPPNVARIGTHFPKRMKEKKSSRPIKDKIHSPKH